MRMFSSLLPLLLLSCSDGFQTQNDEKPIVDDTGLEDTDIDDSGEDETGLEPSSEPSEPSDDSNTLCLKQKCAKPTGLDNVLRASDYFIILTQRDGRIVSMTDRNKGGPIAAKPTHMFKVEPSDDLFAVRSGAGICWRRNRHLLLEVKPLLVGGEAAICCCRRSHHLLEAKLLLAVGCEAASCCWR